MGSEVIKFSFLYAETDRWVYEEGWEHLQTEREGTLCFDKTNGIGWMSDKFKINMTLKG